MVRNDVREVGTKQNQSLQQGAVDDQLAAGQNLDGFDEIDVSGRYQHLHERVEGRKRDEFKKAVQFEDHEEKAQKKSCNLKNTTQGLLLLWGG